MRIISGWAKSRRLVAPPGVGTRPTSDRVREAWFNILGPPPPETRVLDLFAGAGGLGLEAMSRGAASAVFVEQAAPALTCLRQNIAALNLAGDTVVLASEVERALTRLADQEHRFHWVFVDPPYRGGHAEAALQRLGAGGVITESASVMVEHDRRTELPDSVGVLARSDQRSWGDTCVSFYGRVGA